jgi:hypothetical protein
MEAQHAKLLTLVYGNSGCCDTHVNLSWLMCVWLLLLCRDNHRISMQDPALAEQLWSATGLKHTMAGVTVDGMVPIGLNANIRCYRCVSYLVERFPYFVWPLCVSYCRLSKHPCLFATAITLATRLA